MTGTTYDPDNVFARILRGELPCRKVYEDEWALAFHDINPSAPVDVLVVVKGEYASFSDFSATAPAAQVSGYIRAIGQSAAAAGLAANGYRLIFNAGPDSGQEIPHLHVHVLGGRPLGPILPKTS